MTGDGSYTLRVQVEPPDIVRHHKKNGRRYEQGAVAEFANVRIKIGQTER